MATNDIGRVTPIWRGFFSAAVTYELNDIVIDTAGSVWWHKSEELTTGVIPEAGEIWDAVIDMSVFSGLIQAAITTAQTAVQAAQEAESEVAEDVRRAETAAQSAEASAEAASESAAGVGALAQAAEQAKNAAQTAASQAAASASSAGASATSAGSSAQTAEAAKTAAQTAATQAAGSAETASGAAAVVEQKKAEAIAAIEAKGEEVLESIPEDYTELSGDVGDLKTQLKEDEPVVNLPEPVFSSGYYDENLDFISFANAVGGTLDISNYAGNVIHIQSYTINPMVIAITDKDGHIIYMFNTSIPATAEAEKTIYLYENAKTLYISHATNHDIKYRAFYYPNESINSLTSRYMGSENVYNLFPSKREIGYYYNSELVKTPVATASSTNEYVIVGLNSITLRSRATSGEFNGFVDVDGNVIETWQQNDTEVTKTVPPNAYKLLVTHGIQNIANYYVRGYGAGYAKEIKEHYENINTLSSLLYKGGNVKNISTTPLSGYYNSNLEYIYADVGTLFAYEIDVADIITSEVKISAYAQSAAYCGFIDSDNNIVSKWQQNRERIVSIPANAYKLLISHGTGRGVIYSCIMYEPVGGVIEDIKSINADIDITKFSPYDATKTYKRGEYVEENNKIERCLIGISSPEIFNQSKWEETTLQNDLGISYPNFPMMKLNGLKWKACGDSLTSDLNGWSYVPVVANLLGIGDNDYTNEGVGGAKILACGTEASNPPGDNNIVTLFAGTNDFGSSSGATPIATFKDNVDSVIERYIRGSYNARLYVITPIPRFDKLTNEFDLSLTDYVNVLLKECSTYNVPVLNLYDLIMLNPYNYTKYLVDGLHPTTYGKYRISVFIAKFISECERIRRMINFGT